MRPAGRPCCHPGAALAALGRAAATKLGSQACVRSRVRRFSEPTPRSDSSAGHHQPHQQVRVAGVVPARNNSAQAPPPLHASRRRRSTIADVAELRRSSLVRGTGAGVTTTISLCPMTNRRLKLSAPVAAIREVGQVLLVTLFSFCLL